MARYVSSNAAHSGQASPGKSIPSAAPGAPQGIEGEKMLTSQFGAAFSNAHFDIESLVGEGDQVAMRYTYHGMHTGTFNGLPATGKAFSAGGINIVRFENGKIVENWVQFDVMGLLQQLGVIPAPAQA